MLGRTIYLLLCFHRSITEKFLLGKTKETYVICYGLAPFFKLNLLDIVKQTPYITISFDESYNNVIKRGQMYVVVRFWDSNVNKVSKRYVNSESLGKSSAADVL